MKVRFSVKKQNLSELEKKLRKRGIWTEIELNGKFLHAKAPNYSVKLYPRSADISETLYKGSTPQDEELSKIVGKLYPISLFTVLSCLVGFGAVAYLIYLAFVG